MVIKESKVKFSIYFYRRIIWKYFEIFQQLFSRFRGIVGLDGYELKRIQFIFADMDGRKVKVQRLCDRWQGQSIGTTFSDTRKPIFGGKSDHQRGYFKFI